MVRFFKDKKGYPRDKKDGEYIHRKVARKKVGGFLYPGTVVHHKDGNKSNFRKSNLQVMSRSRHSKLHYNKRKNTN
jgi:hypothetical protein